jgi:hypothetical protein
MEPDGVVEAGPHEHVGMAAGAVAFGVNGPHGGDRAVSEAKARAHAWRTGSSPTLSSTRTHVVARPVPGAVSTWRRSSIHPQPNSGSSSGPGTAVGARTVSTSGPGSSTWKDASRVRMAPYD